MSSRRRNSKKNLGNSLSDIQRRLRRMERKPIRTRLQNRVIKGSAIAPSTITAEEVDFGTTVITNETPADVVDNPKDGLLVVDPDTNSAFVYSETQGDYVEIQDAAAVAIAQGKSKTYVQDNEPTGGTYSLGDLWIDTNDGNKLYAYSGSAWAAKQDGAISTAQATANGKNKVYYDTAVPGSTANTAGDIWWQYASGVVVGQYVGAGGTSWTSAPIGNTVIANLDAGKITTGYIDVAGSVKITTSATASGTGGTTARIEINSTGFYAYDGSVATVSITNTGTAVFSGTVNATAGAFTGYVTAGTARFGAAVQTGKNGIYINANNYWYDDATFKVGDSSESMSWTSAGGLVVTGEINANSGTFSGTITASGTISGGTISGATVTGGIISTNAVTSSATVSTSTPRITLADQYLSQASSGIGIVIDTGAGTTPGGINANANLSGTQSTMAIYSQGHGGGTGVLSLNSGSTGTSGYALIGVSGGSNSNSIQITNTKAVLAVGSTYGDYALRNIKCVTSFTQASDTTGTDGDVVLVYTP